jgi:hypothetical protein
MFVRKLSLSVASLLLATPLVSQALPPHNPDLVTNGNRWSITAYDDSSPVHTQWATQGICFYPAGVVGTHQRYYWVSDTFPDWNGRATQEGDQVFMHGDYAGNVGHDGIQFEITTSTASRNEGYGHWQEWREDSKYGLTIGYVNAKLARVGKCTPLTVAEAIDLGTRIELKLNANKELAVVPFGLSEREILVVLEQDK